MKKVILILAVAMCSLLSYSQTNLMVWNNGRMQYAQPIVNVDSLTFPDNVLASDTLQFILPRSKEVYIYDTVVIHDTLRIVKTDTVEKVVYVNYCYAEGALEGVFTVGDGKQVHFAKGNLQYSQSANKWVFARHQYDMLGTDNVTGGTVKTSTSSGNSITGTDISDRIDLFSWSTTNTATSWGVTTSTNTGDYSDAFVDWGVNLGDGITWRTLTNEEWKYLFETRTNADSLYGVARINLTSDGSQYVNGLVILPDEWACPSGVTFKRGVTTSGSSVPQAYAVQQTFTVSQWRQLEQAGAVFLPTGGSRLGTNVMYVQFAGYYWSSTKNDEGDIYGILFTSKSVTQFSQLYYTSQAVRLVQDL